MKLQHGEQILHELQPAPPIVFIWFFSKSIPAAFTAAFLLAFFIPVLGLILTSADGETGFFRRTGLVGLVAVPAVLIASLIYVVYLRKTYRYYITDRRCVLTGGILRRVERSVPFHKITDVEISATILDRLAKISTLKIFTPGSTGMRSWPFWAEQAEIEFVGLRDSETPAATVNTILATYKATGE